MNYLLDLFSGIGGFTLGLQNAGIKFDEVYYSDIDKYANAVYKYNFPNHKEVGDVTSIRPENLPKGRWVVTFGFPCQDLSIAGKRAGFEGKRSSLFYEATRIIRTLKPEVFIFENVKGLFSANEGQDFISVLREIADIGLYDCEWQLVNTRWVLPQNRERIYFIGHLRGSSGSKVFPVGKPSQKSGGNEKGNYSGTVKEGFGKTQNDATYICHTLDANYHKGIGKQYRECIIENQHQITTAQPRCGNPKKGGTGELSSSEYCFTLDSQPHIGNKIRRLTPIECERLQGFPDNWTAKGNFDGEIKEISDTQRYKMCGNAVTVKIVEMIGKRLNDLSKVQ